VGKIKMVEQWFILNEPQEEHLFKEMKTFPYRDFDLMKFIRIVEKGNQRVIAISYDKEEHNIMIHTINK
jgi:hypothetical protein